MSIDNFWKMVQTSPGQNCLIGVTVVAILLLCLTRNERLGSIMRTAMKIPLKTVLRAAVERNSGKREKPSETSETAELDVIEVDARESKDSEPPTDTTKIISSRERYVGSTNEFVRKPTLPSQQAVVRTDALQERDYALIAKTAEVELLHQENVRLRNALTQVKDYLIALLERDRGF